MQNSKKRFKSLLKKFVLKDEGSLDKLAKDLFSRYSGSSRHYHTTDHVISCLEELKQLEDAVEYFELPIDFDRLKLALWYHDVMETEEDSVDYLSNDLKDALLYPFLIEEVYDLILATKPDRHPSDMYQRYIKDIDVSILGKNVLVFRGYENKVRKEYFNIGNQVFCEGRINILKSFVKRKNIYYTRYFRDRYEDAARKNIEESIKHLEEGNPVWPGVYDI
jgi:predicted metal-dependent HD superfamily phosphohydrolase